MKRRSLIASFTVALASAASAQDAVEANNPLANVRALNFHNYYIGELSEIDRPGNTLNLRYAQPFRAFGGNWLVRATLPINSFPVADGGREAGLGDLNVFATYVLDLGRPGLNVGIGPLFVAPTANEDALGAGKWQLGVAHVLFNTASERLQWGYLATWQTDVAGDDERDDVSLGVLQPVGILQLGNGWYARSSGAWTYNFETDDYAIPVGMGLGKVISTPGIVYNAFVEPQYTLDSQGPGQPVWQVFVGLNLQFGG